MSPQEKLTMRNEFAAIFNDIQDSVLRTLYDMPRPLLMILRLVVVSFLGHRFLSFRVIISSACQRVRIEMISFDCRKISSTLCGNSHYAIITFTNWTSNISTEDYR